MTPVILVSGLLGSGKTTLINHLLAQKPSHERWGVVVNDFGPLTLDGALIDADQVVEVAGGCLCCSAHAGLRQALQQLRRHDPTRILIEPTGLGHPDTLIDALRHAPGMQLSKVISVVTPAQLTPERWRKSELLRKIVTLADLLVLNKIDLSTCQDRKLARDLLETLPQPPEVVETTRSRLALDVALAPPHRPLRLWPATEGHATRSPAPHDAALTGLLEAWRLEEDGLLSVGYRFSADTIFSRPALRALFEQTPPLRAKGLLRTGRHWQLLQWTDDRLTLEDYAWRADSRLLVFWPADRRQDIAAFEAALNGTARLKPL